MKRGRKMVNRKSVPLGVKTISVLYYVGAVFSLILSISFILDFVLFDEGADSSVGQLVYQYEPFDLMSILTIASFIMIVLGVLGFFVGRGLWKARPWARIVAIIFSCLGIISAVSSINGGYTSIVYYIFDAILVISGCYLLFSTSVKKAFA